MLNVEDIKAHAENSAKLVNKQLADLSATADSLPEPFKSRLKA